MLCGSAPMRGNVMTFMRATMGCVIVEGYGLTECVGPVTLNVPGDPHPDQVITCGKKVSKLPNNAEGFLCMFYCILNQLIIRECRRFFQPKIELDHSSLLLGLAMWCSKKPMEMSF